MRLHRASYLPVLLAAVVMLLGCLALWRYPPASGKSSKQIAIALLEYHNVTATNGLGALGTELPSSLMLYNDWNPSSHAGPDFAQTYYMYYRFGIYFERSFDLKRDLPGGDTWTLTSTVRAFFPIIGERWWTQEFVTISNSGFSAPHRGRQRVSLASDAVIGRDLPGIWRMTVFASENGCKATATITTNGDYSEICHIDGSAKVDKWSGTVEIKNGFLIKTVTNEDHEIPSTERHRIIYADGRKMLISLFPDSSSSYEFLLEKETK